MANHQSVRVHGVERHGSVDQRLPLLDGGGADRHVDYITAKPLTRQLKACPGTCRVLEKQIDNGSAAKR